MTRKITDNQILGKLGETAVKNCGGQSGEPSPPLRLHHELRRAPRPRHLAAVRLQGAARLPRAGAGGGGVRTYFALSPPAGVTDLAALTPGDFAVVHRKAGFLWKHGEPEALADMLRAECEAKPDRPRPIGFRP